MRFDQLWVVGVCHLLDRGNTVIAGPARDFSLVIPTFK